MGRWWHYVVAALLAATLVYLAMDLLSPGGAFDQTETQDLIHQSEEELQRQSREEQRRQRRETADPTGGGGASQDSRRPNP